MKDISNRMKRGGLMRLFRRFRYGMREGIRNIFRNKIFSLASVGTIAACVFLLGVSVAVILNVQATMRQMESSVGMSVFFKEGISQEQKNQIGKEIQSKKEAAQVKYVSAEEAWAKYKKEVFKDNEDLLEGFEGSNPLNESDSYEVTLKEVSNHEELVKELESINGVRKVKYSKVAAEGIAKLNTLGTYMAAALIIILLLVSVFLVSNTVSIGISVRKEEISIMQLIGAANGFIKAPFCMEGILIGAAGSAIPIAAIYFGYHRIVLWMTERFYVVTAFLKFVPVEEVMIYLIPLALVIGLLIGMLGSFITIHKYLKV